MGTQIAATFTICCAILIFQTRAAPHNQTKGVENLSVLKYGDSCSWEAEQLRLDMSAYVLKRENPPHNIAWRMVELGQPLCNEMDLTVCNKATGKCDCGEPGIVLVMGDRSRASFTVEDQKCRFAVGAYCNPNDVDQPEYKQECAKGSSCISKSTGKECTFLGMANAARSAQSKTVKDILKDMVTGKYCSCKESKKNVGPLNKNTASKGKEHIFLYFGAFQIALYVFI